MSTVRHMVILIWSSLELQRDGHPRRTHLIARCDVRDANLAVAYLHVLVAHGRKECSASEALSLRMLQGGPQTF